MGPQSPDRVQVHAALGHGLQQKTQTLVWFFDDGLCGLVADERSGSIVALDDAFGWCGFAGRRAADSPHERRFRRSRQTSLSSTASTVLRTCCRRKVWEHCVDDAFGWCGFAGRRAAEQSARTALPSFETRRSVFVEHGIDQSCGRDERSGSIVALTMRLVGVALQVGVRRSSPHEGRFRRSRPPSGLFERSVFVEHGIDRSCGLVADERSGSIVALTMRLVGVALQVGVRRSSPHEGRFRRSRPPRWIVRAQRRRAQHRPVFADVADERSGSIVALTMRLVGVALQVGVRRSSPHERRFRRSRPPRWIVRAQRLCRARHRPVLRTCCRRKVWEHRCVDDAFGWCGFAGRVRRSSPHERRFRRSRPPRWAVRAQRLCRARHRPVLTCCRRKVWERRCVDDAFGWCGFAGRRAAEQSARRTLPSFETSEVDCSSAASLSSTYRQPCLRTAPLRSTSGARPMPERTVSACVRLRRPNATTEDHSQTDTILRSNNSHRGKYRLFEFCSLRPWTGKSSYAQPCDVGVVAWMCAVRLSDPPPGAWLLTARTSNDPENSPCIDLRRQSITLPKDRHASGPLRADWRRTNSHLARKSDTNALVVDLRFGGLHSPCRLW